MKTDKQVNEESTYKFLQSLSKKLPTIEPFRYNEKKRKRKKNSTTTKEPKVIGEQPEIVPPNQLNLFQL